ncbi:MAG: thioredoxin-dependent thiol peroxidase [Candidatus Omnitrophica bacterium]|nr:thioredoxin-dependent thiol peroxidase [Candidatus Omnitrophota bacterium]
MAKLKEGIKAPAFSATAHCGEKISLKSFLGKKNVVLYFYPKDNTPGCTVEACGFAKANKKIENQDTVVIGVSPDSTASHNKFIDKFKLPFILISDEDKAVCKAYGVWAKKKLYGREYMGVLRQTFVIGKKGNIEKIYETVKPDGHAEEVLEFIKTLG